MDATEVGGPADMGPILVDQLHRLCAPFALGDGMASELWAAIAAAGFQHALLTEEQGGHGVTPVQAMGLVRAAAGLTLPVPLAETMVAQALHAGIKGRERAGTLSWSCVAGTARQVGRSLLVTAQAPAVPFGRFADHVLVPLRCDGALYLAALPVALARIDKGSNLAGEPRDTMAWDDVPLPQAAVSAVAQDIEDVLLVAGAFVRSQQMVGAMQRALDHAVDHARQRKQFGQPIGHFQAVAHLLAVAAGHLAAATAAADAAAGAYGADGFDFAVAVAKSRVGEAAGVVAAHCHQVMGAMGYTREHELHRVTRRLWAWRDEFGAESLWQERIGRSICADGGDRLWQTVVDGFPPARGDKVHG